MENLNIIEIASFIASIASLILAIVAINAAKTSEKEVRENFEKTQKVMSEYQERTKEVLAEIDKKSAIIERTVSESQKQLMDTMTNIINETVIPKKKDMGEEFGMQLMTQLMTNPNQANDMMDALKPLMEMAKSQKNKKL